MQSGFEWNTHKNRVNNFRRRQKDSKAGRDQNYVAEMLKNGSLSGKTVDRTRQ